MSMTPEEMRKYIESADLPGDGPPPWERPELNRGIVEAAESEEESGYGYAARSCAHAILVVAEAHPELLDVTDEEKRDPSGFEAADNRKLWDAVKDRYPAADDWLGGVTGFQWGWAHNAVRYVLGVEPTGNPALVSISTEGEGRD